MKEAINKIKENAVKMEKIVLHEEYTAASARAMEAILFKFKKETIEQVQKISLSIGKEEFIKRAGCTRSTFYRRLLSGEIRLSEAGKVLNLPENFAAVQRDKRKG